MYTATKLACTIEGNKVCNRFTTPGSDGNQACRVAVKVGCAVGATAVTGVTKVGTGAVGIVAEVMKPKPAY